MSSLQSDVHHIKEMIKNKQVYGGPELTILQDLSFGKHVIDKLRESCDKIALINGKTGEEISYVTLLDRIARIGIGLTRMGIGRGDVVAICSENSTEYVAVTIAASALGAIFTPINIKYTTDETMYVLNISKPKLIFCSETIPATKLNAFLQMSSIKHVVQLRGSVTSSGVQPLATVEVLDCIIEEFKPIEQCGSNDTAFIFYSSGTTGLPKGVMLTHKNIRYGTSVFNYEDNNKCNVLAVLPWYHVYGLMTTMQYLVSGNLVVYLAAFEPDEYLSTIEKYQISEMLTVPPIVHMLATSPRVEKYDLSSVKTLWCGGAPISLDIIRGAQKNLPNCKKIRQSYGMTETGLSVLKEKHLHIEAEAQGSCGVPVPGVIAKIVDAESREKLGPNEQGELCIKGPSIFKGYVDNEEATRAAFDEEGFIKTGDIGYYDEDGRFYIVDRLKELIKYKGQQVTPAAIESVILQHSSVVECGVVGVPDDVAGELPTAFVVPKPGTTLTEKDILDFTSTRLSSISRLRGGVIFVEEIPKTPSGKILRRELRNKRGE